MVIVIGRGETTKMNRPTCFACDAKCPKPVLQSSRNFRSTHAPKLAQMHYINPGKNLGRSKDNKKAQNVIAFSLQTIVTNFKRKYGTNHMNYKINVLKEPKTPYHV